MDEPITSNFDEQIENFFLGLQLSNFSKTPRTGKTQDECFAHANALNVLEKRSGNYLENIAVPLAKKSFVEKKDYLLHTDIYFSIRDVNKEELEAFKIIDTFTQTKMLDEIYFFSQFFSLEDYSDSTINKKCSENSESYMNDLCEKFHLNFKSNTNQLILAGNFDVKTLYEDSISKLLFSFDMKTEKILFYLDKIKNNPEFSENILNYKVYGIVKQDSGSQEFGFYRTIKEDEPKLLYKLGK